MSDIRLIPRRGFLEGLFSAGALVLGARFLTSDASAATDNAAEWRPNVYVGLEPDGTVRIIAHRAEMGTGIKTTLPMVLADEMEADWARVKVEQATGDKKYGDQDTDGSASIRDFFLTMRESGASVRTMLERAAAKQWGVPASECKGQVHFVVHAGSGKKLSYGELVPLASKQPLPDKKELRLKDPADFRYIGKGVPTIDLHDMTTGKAVYGMDTTMPGMVYASIQRSPVIGGKLIKFDDSETKQVRGFQGTVVVDPYKPPYGFQALGGVAVIADNTWAAMQGRKKLKAEWQFNENAKFSSETFRQQMIDTANKPQKVMLKQGDVDDAFSKAAKTHEATYYTPLLAHASMEPPVAVASFADGKVEIWTSTQNPQEVQKTVGSALGIDPSNVTCRMALIGGGFGRKSKPDYVAEAAIISKKVGKPVKVVWSREEDIGFDYYHTTAAMYLKASTDSDGRVTGLLNRSVFPPIGSTFAEGTEYSDKDELSMGWLGLPFDIPNIRTENGPAKAHVRIGWLRSVANVYHAFAMQSFINELAVLHNQDEVEYQLRLIGQAPAPAASAKAERDASQTPEYPLDIARFKRVIDLAATKSGWAKNKSSSGQGWGFAAHRSFYSYVASAVQVDVDKNGKVRIPKVVMAVDCGRVIHPDRVKAQFEGAAVFGTSIAMLGEITAADGRIQQGNFDTYPVARIQESPVNVEVHLINSTDVPTGVGEPGVPPMAPAICNALYKATGKRIYELPVRKQKLV